MNIKQDPFLQQPDQIIDLHGIKFPLEYLFRGTLIVGQPGSGKTRCILMPLVRSILHATGSEMDEKASLIVVDPKNEFGPFIQELLREAGREDDLVILKPNSAFYNPLDSAFLSANEVVEKIISFANNTHRNASQRARGDEAYWANALRSLLTAVVDASRTIHKGKLTFAGINETFRSINKFPNAAAAMDWVKEHHLSETAINGIRDFLSLPDSSTRPCIATSLASTIYFWQSEPLCSLVTPKDNLPPVDPFDIVHRGKVLLIGCSSAAFGVSISPLLVALKEHFFATLLSRDQIEVSSEENRWSPINQKRPVFFLADEFQSYLTPDASMGELVALDRLRSFHGGYIAATQNLASLTSVLGDSSHATRLISLFANQAFLANICPYTARQAEHILGKRRNKERQKEINDPLPPPLLFRQTPSVRSSRGGTVIEISREVPRVTDSTLAAMRTGEFYLRLANGKVHRKTAPFIGMVQAK